MRRVLILFCTAAILYLSASYWYLPNSPYPHYALQNLSSSLLYSIGTTNRFCQSISKQIDSIKYWFLSRSQLNEYLKNLEKIKSELQQAKVELITSKKIIDQLQSLQKFSFPRNFNQVTVRVYGAPIGFYDAQLITASPQNANIQKDDIAANEKGLVGRVTESSDRILRIMLITDMASRVPVKILETGEGAMVIGNGTSTMSLENLQSQEMITNSYKRPPAVGDILVTSGVGGIFPPDIMVGAIAAIKNDEIQVKSFVTFHSLEVVSILYDHMAL